MKKAKLLIAVLVCAVMMMGVGYAWWTDVITIKGTAQTGNMNVVFGSGTVASVKSDYVTATVSRNEAKDVVTCEFGNLYPGASAAVVFEVVNTGTVPVVFDGYEITNAGYLNGMLEFDLDDNNSNGDKLAPNERKSYTGSIKVKGMEAGNSYQNRTATFQFKANWKQLNASDI